MRTKTLLLTAALAAAGAATSMAQSIYSVNAVGYVNKVVVSGYSIVANPFVVADESIGTLIPAGSVDHALATFRLDDTGAFHPNNYDPDPAIGWDNPADLMNLGGGTIIQNGGAAFTVTFVGEVKQGNPVSNPIPNTTAINGNVVVRSSKVPQAAGPTVLGLLPSASAKITRYAADGVGFLQNNYDPTVGWDFEDAIGIAEGFFIQTGANETWDRNFSVN